MSKDRNKSVPAVYLILRDEDKVLLMRRVNTGYYDGSYSLCAGHVETGELPIQALARESKEELGISINEKSAKLVHCMYRTKHDETGDRSDLFFEVRKWSGNIENKEPQKCDDITWFRLFELPSNMMHHVRTALELIQGGKGYSELGSDYFKSFH